MAPTDLGFTAGVHMPPGSATLGGFAMGVGYLAGTLGPLLGRWLYGATGGWETMLWLYEATPRPRGLRRPHACPGRYLEDKVGT